jgi:hypothetical protein
MVKIEETVSHPDHVQFSETLNAVPVGLGVNSVEEIRDELLGYFDVLLGRVPSPVNSPYLSLMEVAVAYHARACEIEGRIHEGEREGLILRGSELNRLRTGLLRSFIASAKLCAQAGSRRLTQEQLLVEARFD